MQNPIDHLIRNDDDSHIKEGSSIMKRFRLLVVSAFMALAIPAAYAQNATPDQMQGRFNQMQTMMDQMPQAKTPAERQKLVAEHMKLMQEQMSGMHGMMGQSQGSSSVDPKNAPQIRAMQQRMDMMQGMMEQMLQQQSMMQPIK